jgi:hypothetical protein
MNFLWFTMHFQSFSTIKTNRSKWYYLYESRAMHIGPLSQIAAGGPWSWFQQGGHRELAVPAKGATPVAGEWRRSTGRPARTHGWPRLASRWPEEAGPRGATARRRLAWPQGSGGFRLGRACARGVARWGEDGGARGCGRGGLEWWGLGR